MQLQQTYILKELPSTYLLLFFAVLSKAAALACLTLLYPITCFTLSFSIPILFFDDLSELSLPQLAYRLPVFG
jgi:hypothetical protein